LIDLTAKVTGTLPVGNGGVGLASHIAGDMLYASSTSALARVAKGTSGQFMTTNGTIPSWTSTIDGGTFGS
jgi:threonine synthase